MRGAVSATGPLEITEIVFKILNDAMAVDDGIGHAVGQFSLRFYLRLSHLQFCEIDRRACAVDAEPRDFLYGIIRAGDGDGGDGKFLAMREMRHGAEADGSLDGEPSGHGRNWLDVGRS